MLMEAIFFLVTTGVRCIRKKTKQNRSALSGLLGAIACQFPAAYSNS